MSLSLKSDLDIDALLAQEQLVLGDNNISQPNVRNAEPSLLAKLEQAWLRERLSPELCAFPQKIISSVCAQIDIQRQRIELLEQSADRFRSVILQTELERVGFLLRSLIRSRISKIEEYPLFYSQEQNLKRLGPVERHYLNQHNKILFRHMSKTVLDNLPEKFRRIDDTQDRVSMIDAPPIDDAVFCRVTATNPEIEIIDGDENIPLVKDSLLLIRYSAVAPFIGKYIELI